MEIITNQAIGQTLAKLRRERGLTQMELGRAMRADGVTVSRWERGQCGMAAVTLLEANRLLNGELLRALQWE